MPRILAVDDSPSMRQMVGVTLKSAGYEVLEACDGQEALNLAKGQAAVDLVITDVNMPNMDGIPLVRELRALPHYPCVPLLFLPTSSTPWGGRAGGPAGAAGGGAKPGGPDRRRATIA